MARLTSYQKTVLQAVADGAWLLPSIEILDAFHHLEKKGLVETVRTEFISQVSFRITPAGRAALKESK